MTDQLVDNTLALIANGRIEAERAFMRDRVENFRKFQARRQREREAYANAVLTDACRVRSEVQTTGSPME